MSQPRMLVGGAALALIAAGIIGMQWYSNAAGPGGAVVTAAGEPVPQAMTALSPSPPPSEAALSPDPPTTADASLQGPGAAAPKPSGELMVHVVGAVRKPGVYRLPAKARLAEAIRAAGGAKAGADLEAVNLASFLQDGEQIRVPSLAERRAVLAATSTLRAQRLLRSNSPARPTRSTARYPVSAPAPSVATTDSGPAAAPADGPVNLNTAGAEELDTLPGVGPSTAAAILEFRREHGPFQSVEDLLQVRGIGEKKLAAMRERVTVR
jgi:competence protein ComEA